MNRVYLRNEPIRDEPVFIGTNLFMAKSFGELEPMKPKTSTDRFFCPSCRNRCPGYYRLSTTIEGSDEISGDQDRKKIISERLVFNVRSYRSGLIPSSVLILKCSR
jgi:hypothetical protein